MSECPEDIDNYVTSFGRTNCGFNNLTNIFIVGLRRRMIKETQRAITKVDLGRTRVEVSFIANYNIRSYFYCFLKYYM